jgi:hypothetical protein
MAGSLSGAEKKALVSRIALTSRLAGATLVGKDGHLEAAKTARDVDSVCDAAMSQ